MTDICDGYVTICAGRRVIMIGSAATPTTSTSATPPVVHGLAYGVLASVMMWIVIAAVIYNFV